MRTVVDPFTGEKWSQRASRREAVAGAIVLLSCIFLFVVLPLL